MSAGVGLTQQTVRERLAASLDWTPAATAAGVRAYAWANDFAWQIVAVASSGDRVALATVFGTIERLLDAELEPDARALVVTGVLDPLQSITTSPSAKVRSREFVGLLGPATQGEWQRLHSYWGSTDDELIGSSRPV